MQDESGRWSREELFSDSLEIFLFIGGAFAEPFERVRPLLGLELEDLWWPEALPFFVLPTESLDCDLLL